MVDKHLIKFANALRGTLNQVGNLGSYDDIPAFDGFTYHFINVDPANPNILIFGYDHTAGGKFSKKRNIKVTIEFE